MDYFSDRTAISEQHCSGPTAWETVYPQQGTQLTAAQKKTHTHPEIEDSNCVQNVFLSASKICATEIDFFFSLKHVAMDSHICGFNSKYLYDMYLSGYASLALFSQLG